MILVLFIFVNLVFFCPKMILRIKIEISRNDLHNSIGFYFHNKVFVFHEAKAVITVSKCKQTVSP